MVESNFCPLADQLAIAENLETKDKWEPAYRNYHAVANKAMEQIANEQNAQRKTYLKGIAEKAIMQAQWCKQMIEDQKRQLKPKIKRSNTQA